jgi:hypothetical protein
MIFNVFATSVVCHEKFVMMNMYCSCNNVVFLEKYLT